MKAVDSVTIRRAIRRAELMNYEHNELYTTWNTTKVHCYGEVELPETYKIDLRGFTMPTSSRTVTSGFGYRPTFRRMHKGVDVKVYTGDTIVSAFDGKVRIVDYEADGYGYYVVIRHKNGLETIYGHLSKQLVSEGDVVKSGQVIGLGGNTGRSFGSHLHFETRFLGVALNPALLFDFANQDVTGDFYVFRRDREVSAPVQSLAVNKTTVAPLPSGKVYRVKSGDTLERIASHLGITLDDLCRLNSLSATARIRPDQMLRY